MAVSKRGPILNSGLARGVKIPTLDRNCHYRVYIWDDGKFAESNVDALVSADACHVPMPYVSLNGLVKIPPVLGEIHFKKDKWDVEVVSHECVHAMFHYGRVRNLDDLAGMSVEEQLCYFQGDLADKIYRWLWKTEKEIGSDQ